MKKKKPSESSLDKWFNDLDSNEKSIIFPNLFEHIMESADPDVDINTFNDESTDEWNSMTYDQKLKEFMEF